MNGNTPALEHTKVCLRVPATTANLGPAYDVMGMALSIFMELTVEVADTFSFTVEGDGAEHIALDETNMVYQTCKIAFEEYAHRPMPPLRFTMHNNIPYGCGCGSSSAAAVAGFVAGMTLCGLAMRTKEKEELLEVVARIEGHPDNAAPAIYGGIQLGYRTAEGHVGTYRVPQARPLSIVLFVPHKLMKASTHVTRSLIADTVSLPHAIQNISGAAILVLALTTGSLELLTNSSDHIHEMQRASALYPHYAPCAAAARTAGASYAFLSGAGPTVCALVGGRHGDILTQHEDERTAVGIAEAMVAAAHKAGVEGRAIITQPSDLGVHFVGRHPLSPGVEYINI